ncbi:MAG: glucose-6-phosphate isomerase family protein [Terracidiphilus sp.]|nr:glucose-6-phosphate isomerase family protein [Terracidiphilus sp.]
MLMPEGVAIDSITGAVSPATGRYTKRLSELRELFQDRDMADKEVERLQDPVVYEIAEYRKPGSDIFFGTTTMSPGRVGREYYMTRGHFHERQDAAEVYYTQHGEGILLLELRDEQSMTVEMRPGLCAFIPPGWAHRSINTGSEKLIFVWMCNVAVGHDYGDILKRGMRKLVVARNQLPELIDNPSWGH